MMPISGNRDRWTNLRFDWTQAPITSELFRTSNEGGAIPSVKIVNTPKSIRAITHGSEFLIKLSSAIASLVASKTMMCLIRR